MTIYPIQIKDTWHPVLIRTIHLPTPGASGKTKGNIVFWRDFRYTSGVSGAMLMPFQSRRDRELT